MARSICTIEGCGRPQNARGYCPTHYGMWWKHGDPLYAEKGLHKPFVGRGNANTLEDFWASVEKTDTCWIWSKSKDKDGYGFFWWKNRQWRAARFVAAVILQLDIEEKEVCHTCDNPSCVRPDHLFVGTSLDNARDREAKGRGTKGRPHSEEHVRNQANSRRGKMWTEEMKERQRERMKKWWEGRSK